MVDESSILNIRDGAALAPTWLLVPSSWKKWRYEKSSPYSLLLVILGTSIPSIVSFVDPIFKRTTLTVFSSGLKVAHINVLSLTRPFGAQKSNTVMIAVSEDHMEVSDRVHIKYLSSPSQISPMPPCMACSSVAEFSQLSQLMENEHSVTRNVIMPGVQCLEVSFLPMRYNH